MCIAFGLGNLVFKRVSGETTLVKNGFFWLFLVAAIFGNPGSRISVFFGSGKKPKIQISRAQILANILATLFSRMPPGT